jgi:predicted N-acetyltransferase YhbS
MNMIRLVQAQADQAALVCRMIVEVFEVYRGAFEPPSGAHDETPQTIREKMARPDGGALLAYVDEALAGVTLYCRLHDTQFRNARQTDAMYLGRLAVMPAYRRFGVGAALVAAVEGKAVGVGLARVVLGVRTALPGNRAYFERLGYRTFADKSHGEHAELTYLLLDKRVP